MHGMGLGLVRRSCVGREGGSTRRCWRREAGAIWCALSFQGWMGSVLGGGVTRYGFGGYACTCSHSTMCAAAGLVPGGAL